MTVMVAVFEPIDDLVHEAGDLGRRWALIRRRTTARIGHVHRPLSPKPRSLVTLEITRVEVQIEDNAVEPAKVWVSRHDSDVVHRVGVTRNGHPVAVFRRGDFLAGNERRRLPFRNHESFDRYRASHRAGPHLTSELAQPRPGDAGCISKFGAKLVEFSQVGFKLLVQTRDLVEHDG